jgi:hypothetical protein
MARGILPQLTDGRPSDDGILDESTRDAIELYLRQRGVIGEQRSASLGEEIDPDYWPRLLEMLELDAARST